MYSFKGTLRLDSESQTIPLDTQQLLLQVLLRSLHTYIMLISLPYLFIYFPELILAQHGLGCGCDRLRWSRNQTELEPKEATFQDVSPRQAFEQVPPPFIDT